MPDIIKLRYMDEPLSSYTEWFCKTDSARMAISEAGLAKPGDRVVMKSGDIFIYWDDNKGWSKVVSGGSGGGSSFEFEYKGTVPTYQDLPDDAEQGDMYSVNEDGKVYFWDGNNWNEIEVPSVEYTFLYQGWVEDYSDLPQTGNHNGDVYQIDDGLTILIYSEGEWEVVMLSTVMYSSQVDEKFVNFYNHLGFRIYSYDRQTIQTMTRLPDAPLRPGFDFDNWNWTLEELKNADSEVNVGAVYHQHDSEYNTVIGINITNEKLLDFSMYLNLSGTVSIDWGVPGVEPIEYTGDGYTKIDTKGVYVIPKTYVIKIKPVTENDSFTIGSITKDNENYCLMGVYNNSQLQALRNIVQYVHIGKGCTLGNYGLANMYHISYLTFNQDVDSIGAYACQNCIILNTVIFPQSENGVVIGAAAFYNCHALNVLSTPYNILSIGISASYACYALNVFNYYNANLNNIDIANHFVRNCRGLKGTINMGDNVVSVVSQAFQNCSSVEKIKYFGDLAGSTIGQDAFGTCYSLYEYDFRYCTEPPVLPGITSTYIYLTENTKIYISDEYKSKWLSASNWANLDEYYVYIK